MCRDYAFSTLVLAVALGCRADATPGAAAARDTQPQAEATAALAPSDTALPPADSATTDSFSSATLAQLGHLVSQRWSFDLDSMVVRRAIRVLVVPSPMLYFEDRGRLRGASYEMVNEFERALNKKFRTGSIPIECIFIPVPRDQLITRLAEGRGDLAVGLIQATPDRREQVDFSDPVYEGVREVVVTGPGAPELQTLEDLSGREVYVRPSSSYAEHLRELNRSWRDQGRTPIAIRPADENLEDGDILEMVNTGVVPITVVNGSDAEFYRGILTDLTVHDSLVLASGGTYAWAMRKNTPQLMAEVNRFVRDHRVGTTFGNVVARRYFRDNPWIRNPASVAALQRYEQTVGEFRKAGAEFGLDPLLLLAQGYQESGLDQSRRSSAGAVGVMQIKPSTAAGPPIGITGVDRLENNVRAGAKYLRFIIDRYYTDSAMTPLNREIFALASYNAGPARIAGIRRRAAAAGLDPDLWFQHVEVLVSKEIGRETVDYVRNIYKYYLTYNLLEQRQQDRERAQAAAGDRR
jgi:membrane-bound lytic murein transglycosylase MltF